MRVCPRCSAPLSGNGALGDPACWSCSSCGNTPIASEEGPVLTPAVADGFDPASFEMLAGAEESSFWFRQRNALITEAVRRFAGGARSFLEIGCGNGYVLQAIGELFPAMAVAGAELHPEGLPYARRRLPDVPLLQRDARVAQAALAEGSAGSGPPSPL